MQNVFDKLIVNKHFNNVGNKCYNISVNSIGMEGKIYICVFALHT